MSKKSLGMVIALVTARLLLSPVSAGAATIVVSPATLASTNWAFDNRDSAGTAGADPTAGGSLVTGPGTPPLGTGSANLFSGDGTVGGDGAGELRNTGYAGTLLSAITTLTYSTYDTQNNGQQFPYFGLNFADNGGLGPNTDILFFEPPYQTPASGNPSLPDQGATVMNQWQTWDALDGGWYDENGLCGAGAGTNVVSFATCLSDIGYTNPALVNAAGGLGAVRFDVGFASPSDQFNGYVDNFTIGVSGVNTTYDFEGQDVQAQTVPEPSSLALLGIGVFGLASRLRRRSS